MTKRHWILDSLKWLPDPKEQGANRVDTLGACLGIGASGVRKLYFGAKDASPEQIDILQKLASPEYGYVFAAIRLTALGVADQYDWGDK